MQCICICTYQINRHYNNNSEPLIGAIVSLDGTSAAAVTDTDGKYALSLPNPGSYSISASLVGYLPVHKKVKLTDKTTSIVDIVMDENPTLLDEVVVTANRNAVKRSQAPVVVNILNHKIFVYGFYNNLINIHTQSF